MSRERNTLVGTPTIIAPEAIRLTCDFGIPGENIAVYAAIASYATAQYFPRVHALSPLVSTAVDMAKTDLGESADALPPGSVLLAPTDSHTSDVRLSAALDAVIAVATVATVFETAGQGIENRKSQILGVAAEAYRFIHGQDDADMDLTTAVHGGFIVAALNPNMPPSLSYPAVPPTLHLVLFQTGDVVSRDAVSRAIAQFANRNPRSYQTIVDELVEQGNRFASEVSQGNATAAIASYGRYGQRLMALSAAASLPIMGEGFARAALLAKEIGGAVKHAGFGDGDLAIALFATPEAVKLFCQACEAPLTILPFALDREGVRCRVEVEPSAAEAMHTPGPEVSGISSDGIVHPSFDEDTTQETLPLPALLLNESAENLALAPAPTPDPESPIESFPRSRRSTPPGMGPIIEMTPPAVDSSEAVPGDSDDEPLTIPKHRTLTWLLVTTITLAAIAIMVWAALPVLRKGDEPAPHAAKPRPAIPPPIPAPPPPVPAAKPILPRAQKATNPATISPPGTEPPAALPTKPPPADPIAVPARERPSRPAHAKAKSAAKSRHRGKTSISDEADSPPVPPPPEKVAPAAASPTPAPAPPSKVAPRAGKLSTDDF